MEAYQGVWTLVPTTSRWTKMSSASSVPPLHLLCAALLSCFTLRLISSCTSSAPCTPAATSSYPHTAALFTGCSYPRVLLLSLFASRSTSPLCATKRRTTHTEGDGHSSLRGIQYVHLAAKCLSLLRQPNGKHFSNLHCLKHSFSRSPSQIAARGGWGGLSGVLRERLGSSCRQMQGQAPAEQGVFYL